ncbi:unnamed protein product [Urochloa decumbens]|uniref:Thaumatin-like protein n=1 Tax=Urochloa decumbens TaxID=240449 RepID=A0ABC8VY91_9POAL
MAATSSSILFLLLAAFGAGGATAATFSVTNNCGFTVWPAATPVGGGTQLNPGQTWTFVVPAGTGAGRVWGRTGCSFDSNGRGSCQTGDCAGALFCTLSGQPPLTLAEFTLGGGGAQDFYDISVIDGYNLAMAFSCSTGDRIVCTSSMCPQAYLFPEDNSKVHACAGNSNYQVTFCP